MENDLKYGVWSAQLCNWPAIYWRWQDHVHSRIEWKHELISRVSRESPEHGNGDRISIGIGFVFRPVSLAKIITILRRFSSTLKGIRRSLMVTSEGAAESLRLTCFNCALHADSILTLISASIVVSSNHVKSSCSFCAKSHRFFPYW